MKAFCAFCKKRIEVSKKEYNWFKKHSWKHYCSAFCRTESKKTGKKVFCANCNKEIYKKQSEIEKSKTGNLFCSKSCSTSKNNKLFKTWTDNPNYISGLGSYREFAFKHLPPNCFFCDYAVKQVLEVHHVDGNRENNLLENLLILCPTHHKELELGVISLSVG